MGTETKQKAVKQKGSKAAANNRHPPSRNKMDSDVSGSYVKQVQSLLDIWNVLASASQPLTAGEVGKRMREKDTSPQTAERRLNESIHLINTIFPHTVLHEAGKPAILHTYPHNGALHVVLENPDGVPFWEGSMTAEFCESATNPLPQSTLNRKIPELTDDYNAMKKAVKKAAQKGGKNDENQEEILFKDGYPPISLSGIVVTTDKRGREVHIPYAEYKEAMDKLPHDERPKSPTRKFFVDSILTPEEWQLLSDVILVYPYISEQKTDKLLSAMSRMAPGSRQWKKLVHAPKNPNALRFDFIRKLEEAIQAQHKVGIQYGRYQLTHQLGGWKPSLQPDSHGYYETEPYALTWSNGYYYLVCSVKIKRDSGEVVQEMRNFRVDRIWDITSSTIPFKKPDNFDVFRYRDNSPVMYAGKAISITLRCHISMLSVLMDFFGSAIESFSEEDKEHYTTVKVSATENGTKLFALQYLDRVQVLAPQSLRDEIAATLRTATLDYM